MKTNRRKVAAAKLTEGEYTALRILALERSGNISDTIRALIREAAEKRGLPPLGMIEVVNHE